MKEQTKIRYIIFDIGNVLFIDTEGVFDKMFGKNKLSKAKQEKYLKMIHATEKGQRPTNDLLRTMVEVFGLNLSTKQVEEFMIDSALIKPMWRLFNALSKNYKAVILTNNQKNWPDQQAKRLGVSLKKFTVFNSAKIKMRKPNRKIYEYVTRKLKAKTEEIIFVDDRPYNLTEPKKLGWKTIRFDGNVDHILASLKKYGIKAKIR